MNCNEFRGFINDFINSQLPDQVYDEFIDHYHSCDECNEELEILYLVHNTINSDQLENTSFNLNEKLRNHMKHMEELVYARYKYNFCRKTAITFAQVISGIGAVIFVIDILL